MPDLRVRRALHQARYSLKKYCFCSAEAVFFVHEHSIRPSSWYPPPTRKPHVGFSLTWRGISTFAQKSGSMVSACS